MHIFSPRVLQCQITSTDNQIRAGSHPDWSIFSPDMTPNLSPAFAVAVAAATVALVLALNFVPALSTVAVGWFLICIRAVPNWKCRLICFTFAAAPATVAIAPGADAAAVAVTMFVAATVAAAA